MSSLLVFLPMLVFIVALFLSLKIINQNQRGVLFRLGRLERILEPGLFFIVPVVDRVRKVDLNARIPEWQLLSKE